MELVASVCPSVRLFICLSVCALTVWPMTLVFSMGVNLNCHGWTFRHADPKWVLDGILGKNTGIGSVHLSVYLFFCVCSHHWTAWPITANFAPGGFRSVRRYFGQEYWQRGHDAGGQSMLRHFHCIAYITVLFNWPRVLYELLSFNHIMWVCLYSYWVLRFILL